MANDLEAKQSFGLPQKMDSTQYGIELGTEDQIVPRLVLIQPTSAREGAGKFYYSLTGELLDSIECVFFKNVRGRVMFDPDMSKQATICGSNDRLVPSPRFEKPQADRCVECKFSNRSYSEKIMISGKEVFQSCQETQTMIGMFTDSLMQFLFIGRRTSLLPINEFLSAMQFECAKHKKPLCCFPVKLTSKLIQKANQKYYVPTIEKLGMIEREEFTAMMNKYSNYDVDKTFEAEDKIAVAEELSDEAPF